MYYLLVGLLFVRAEQQGAVVLGCVDVGRADRFAELRDVLQLLLAATQQRTGLEALNVDSRNLMH